MSDDATRNKSLNQNISSDGLFAIKTDPNVEYNKTKDGERVKNVSFRGEWEPVRFFGIAQFDDKKLMITRAHHYGIPEPRNFHFREYEELDGKEPRADSQTWNLQLIEDNIHKEESKVNHSTEVIRQCDGFKGDLDDIWKVRAIPSIACMINGQMDLQTNEEQLGHYPGASPADLGYTYNFLEERFRTMWRINRSFYDATSATAENPTNIEGGWVAEIPLALRTKFYRGQPIKPEVSGAIAQFGDVCVIDRDDFMNKTYDEDDFCLLNIRHDAHFLINAAYDGRIRFRDIAGAPILNEGVSGSFKRYGQKFHGDMRLIASYKNDDSALGFESGQWCPEYIIPYLYENAVGDGDLYFKDDGFRFCGGTSPDFLCSFEKIVAEDDTGLMGLSAWDFEGIIPGINTTTDWKLYATAYSLNDTIRLYSNSGRTNIVATGTLDGTTMTFVEYNDSGLSGSCEVSLGLIVDDNFIVTLTPTTVFEITPSGIEIETLNVDHIAERTSSHGIVCDNVLAIPSGSAASPGLQFSTDTEDGLARVSVSGVPLPVLCEGGKIAAAWSNVQFHLPGVGTSTVFRMTAYGTSNAPLIKTVRGRGEYGDGEKVQVGDQLFFFDAFAFYGSAISNDQVTRITAEVTEISGSDIAGCLQFYVRERVADGSNFVKALQLEDDGDATFLKNADFGGYVRAADYYSEDGTQGVDGGSNVFAVTGGTVTLEFKDGLCVNYTYSAS